MKKLVLYRKQLQLLRLTKEILTNKPNDFFEIRDAYFDLFYENQYSFKPELIEILPVQNISAIRKTIENLKNAASCTRIEIVSTYGKIQTSTVLKNIDYLIDLLDKVQLSLSNNTVFYSWQSDRLSSTNRNFIERCIEMAIKKLNKELPYLLRIDSDTRELPGSPNIPDAIAAKIDNAFCFVGDITPIDKKKFKSTKLIPNPNVMFETGYALSTLGEKRIILISNTHFGKIDDLPFDLKIRRMESYCLSTKTTPEDKKKAKDKLAESLYNGFKAISNI